MGQGSNPKGGQGGRGGCGEADGNKPRANNQHARGSKGDGYTPKQLKLLFDPMSAGGKIEFAPYQSVKEAIIAVIDKTYEHGHDVTVCQYA